MMRANPQSRTRFDAFTLVELLVVVTVIAILSGLMLAAMPAVLWQGRSAKCQHNLRQVTLAFILYANDHQSYLPNYSAVSETARLTGLYSAGYLPDPGVLICPVNQAYTQPLMATSQGAPFNSYYIAQDRIRTQWYLASGPYVFTPVGLNGTNSYRIPVVWDQRADTDNPINFHKPNSTTAGGCFGYLDGSVSYLWKPDSVVRP